MNYIKTLHIEGFKKFSILDVQFNEHMNIFVGENEAGKSTILEAIKTVLNQQYRNSDKSILKELFNTQMVQAFLANPSVQNLPYILIELELFLDPKHKNAEYFYGEVYGQKRPQAAKYGIRFECKFNEELGSDLEETILEGKIPYEYYALSWTTFANHSYQTIKRPLNFLSINTSNNDTSTSFNYYNRTLFTSKYDENIRINAKNTFREQLDQAFESIHLPAIDEHRKFGVDSKKVILETILSVYEDSIALENRGSGMESLIKTQIALDRRNGLDVILMEEPENHLCFSNLSQMLQQISEQQGTSQIIVATHSNMIASRLNLNNVLWLSNGSVKSLSNVAADIAEFFVKADDNSFLQLLLSTKTIMVEGATEFLLIPHFYKQITGRTIEEDKVTVISCNGITYEKYLSIAAATDKRIAVLTDNDGNQERIDASIQFNGQHEQQHIFMGGTLEDWTWEACIYRLNQALLDKMIEVQPKAQYLFHKKDYGAVLGKMLNNKADTAYQMLVSGVVFTIPQYVEDAIKWLNG